MIMDHHAKRYGGSLALAVPVLELVVAAPDAGILGHYLPLTRFRRGFAFLAFALALRELAARIAPARFSEIPSFCAIFFCTAANPGCFLTIAAYLLPLGYGFLAENQLVSLFQAQASHETTIQQAPAAKSPTAPPTMMTITIPDRNSATSLIPPSQACNECLILIHRKVSQLQSMPRPGDETGFVQHPEKPLGIPGFINQRMEPFGH